MILVIFFVNLIFGDSLSCYPSGWQTKVPGKTINYSRVGASSARILSTLKLTKIQKGDRVFLYAGVNDVYSGVKPRVTIANLQRAIVLAREEGAAEVYVIVGYDPVGVHRNPKKAAEYSELQKQINGLQMAKIIPVCKTINRKHTHDGIHLSALGNKIFSDHVLKNLN
jgi:lysophospholipase L1-like esterase